MSSRVCLVGFAVMLVLCAACTASTAPVVADEAASEQSSIPDAVPADEEGTIVVVANDFGVSYTYRSLGVYDSVPVLDGTPAGTRCQTVFGTLTAELTEDLGGLTAVADRNHLQINDDAGIDQTSLCAGVLEELGPLGYLPLDEIQVVAGETAGFFRSFGGLEGDIDTISASEWTGSLDSVRLEVGEPPSLVDSASGAGPISAVPLQGAERRYGDFWVVRPQQLVELAGGGESRTCYAVTAIASVSPYESEGPPEWSELATELGFVANNAYFGDLTMYTLEWIAWLFLLDSLTYPAPDACVIEPLTALGWQMHPSTTEFDTEVAYFDVITAPSWMEPDQLVIGVPWAAEPGVFDFDVATDIEPPPGP